MELFARVESGAIDLSEALVLLRKVLGKSQLEFSKMVGVSKKIISDFEVGKGNPTIATINKMFAPAGLAVGLVNKKK